MSQEITTKPSFEYNNRTEKSYLDKGLPVPDNLDFQCKYFLSQVEGHITRHVTKIGRIKAKDYSSKRREQKEYLIWYENWYGKDWQGTTVPPVTDHLQGKYWEQETEPIIQKNKKVGQRRTGQHEVFYVPFSRKAVEDIIASSDVDIEDIKYLVKTPQIRNDDFTKEQFLNYSFEEAERAMRTNGGPAMYLHNQNTKRV